MVDVATHVPFTHERRVVARLLNVFWEEDQTLWQWIVIVDDIVIVRVLARDNACPAGGTKRGGYKGVRKPSPIFSHSIQIWRFQKRMPCKPHCIEPMIIR